MKRRLNEENGDVESGAPAGGAGGACPYLDSVCRSALNFDFDKVCSVSNSKLNVYCCLVCGKFLQGRGAGTPALTHSVSAGHFVFLNLQDARIWCLPDGYEVQDASLEDIRYNARPRPSVAEVAALDRAVVHETDVFGERYVPGYGPMNELAGSDYCTAAVQALAHVPPLRDFFLDAGNYASSESAVVHRFAELVCKLWSRRKLKAAVSAHELLQAASTASGNRFRLGAQADCADFFKFLLNELHAGLLPRKGKSKGGETVVSRCFQGRVEVTTELLPKARAGGGAEAAGEEAPAAKSIRTSKRVVPALMLALELPSSPLFKDSREGKALVPVISMAEALEKYTGAQTFTAVAASEPDAIERRSYRVVQLPPFLILHVGRFSRTPLGVLEKNRTVVSLTVKGLELAPLLLPPEQAAAAEAADAAAARLRALDAASVADLRKQAAELQLDVRGALEKSELVAALRGALLAREAKDRAGALASARRSTVYDLIGNIVHKSQGETAGNKDAGAPDAVLQQGSYLVHLVHRADGQWYELQNRHVVTTMPQLIERSESLIAIYQAR